MGIRIGVEEGEPIADAIGRFRRLIRVQGAYPLNHCKWHKPRRDIYRKPSILNRRRRWNDRVRKLGGGLYSQDRAIDWADDSLMRPRRAMGPLGRYVVT
jgi:ribosomal protein S21